MRRIVAGVAVITSLLPSPTSRSGEPGPVPGQEAPGGDADADVLRILGPQGIPVPSGPDGGSPAPPAGKPAAGGPVAATGGPTASPAPTGTQPSPSRPAAAGDQPSQSRPAAAGTQPSPSRPATAGNQPSASRPAAAGGKPGGSGQGPNTRPHVSKPVKAEPAGKPADDKPHHSRPAPADHRPAGTKSHHSRPAKTRHRHDRPLVIRDPDTGLVILCDPWDIGAHEPFGPGDFHLPWTFRSGDGFFPTVPMTGWNSAPEHAGW